MARDGVDHGGAHEGRRDGASVLLGEEDGRSPAGREGQLDGGVRVVVAQLRDEVCDAEVRLAGGPEELGHPGCFGREQQSSVSLSDRSLHSKLNSLTCKHGKRENLGGNPRPRGTASGHPLSKWNERARSLWPGRRAFPLFQRGRSPRPTPVLPHSHHITGLLSI